MQSVFWLCVFNVNFAYGMSNFPPPPHTPSHTPPPPLSHTHRQTLGVWSVPAGSVTSAAARRSWERYPEPLPSRGSIWMRNWLVLAKSESTSVNDINGLTKITRLFNYLTLQSK